MENTKNLDEIVVMILEQIKNSQITVAEAHQVLRQATKELNNCVYR